MNRGSLRLRLLLAGTVSILVALALSAIGLPVLFERHVERRVVAELGLYLDRIVAGLDIGPNGRLAEADRRSDPRFERPLSGLYWQMQVGDTLLRSRSLWDETLVLPEDELAGGERHQHDIPGPAGTELLALERNVTLPERLGGGTLRAAVAIDSAELRSATRAFAVDLFPYLAVIALFLILATYAQVTVGLRPLATVQRRLAAIRGGEARRLGKAFPNEIQPLAAEVDALLDAREAQVDRARARASDLAHGLKTPLQVLSGDVDRLREKGEAAIAGEIEEVAATMRRHVDRELARARTAAGTPDARADVAEVTRRVLAVITRTPNGARLDWTPDIPPGTTARIDADDLAEALGNLVENAARHARTAVAIGAEHKGDLTVITIADDGPGIPEERLGEALARGTRLDRMGDGAGLGLAIVRDIAEAWSGRFTLRNGENGLEAELALPG
ncbi:MAG: HAMP domain-containing histidine kinase [Bauldia sp.]|uniref:sensor histidine kinase n=1 Tax=Bauldia sp. TaxID=2575872 RepID=UPI001D2FDD65|nr:HAMP domain-containing sensor histidine kinase [Bauldia sp.]MCB1494868.1 HAMP domain-containing histidine kinase [Bauldia sp.]